MYAAKRLGRCRFRRFFPLVYITLEFLLVPLSLIMVSALFEGEGGGAVIGASFIFRPFHPCEPLHPSRPNPPNCHRILAWNYATRTSDMPMPDFTLGSCDVGEDASKLVRGLLQGGCRLKGEGRCRRWVQECVDEVSSSGSSSDRVCG